MPRLTNTIRGQSKAMKRAIALCVKRTELSQFWEEYMSRKHNCHCPSCGKCYTRPGEEVVISQSELGYYIMTCNECLAIPQHDRSAVMVARIRLMERRKLCKRDIALIRKYPSQFNGYDPLNPFGKRRK